MSLTKSFDSVVLNHQENPFTLKDVNESEFEELRQELSFKGFYDGRITCIDSFEIEDRNLILSCVDASFFEFNFARDHGLNFPRPVAVNSIIETETKGIILLKRGEDTYCYQGYWDFPAGLVPFKTPLLERMLNRIEDELGLSKSCLKYSKYPDSFELKQEFFMLYYKMNCGITEGEVRKRLTRSKSITTILKNSEISTFLNSNHVYPTFLGD